MRKLQPTDKVKCRFYNTPEHCFYGSTWEGEIVLIKEHLGEKIYLVSKLGACRLIWLHRSEILRRIEDK